MAQTTIQGSFLGDATVTGAKIGADFISAQTALTTGLATTDEIIVSDAGVIKRMDISVFEIAASQITASGTLPALNGAALTALTAANITASGTLPALNGAALTALTAANITASGTLPALNGAALTALVAGNITSGGTFLAQNGSALTALNGTQITSGTVPPAQLGSGSSIGTKFLRGDSTWQTVIGAVTALSGNVDNRIATFGSTITELNGESTLTFASGVLTVTGNIVPGANNSHDLGTSSLQWQNIYTQDFHLNNTLREEGNSIDGTKGDWTIQEGEENLFILNNKTGKKYKFNLTEVS